MWSTRPGCSGAAGRAQPPRAVRTSSSSQRIPRSSARGGAASWPGTSTNSSSSAAEPRVRFLGPLPRDRVVALFHAADASILSSSWENFPHGVVEALAAGTPVLATAAGGVAEVVRDGENGLLVAPEDAAGLGEAIRRFAADAGLRERLRAAAAPSVAAYAPGLVLARLEGTVAPAGRTVG